MKSIIKKLTRISWASFASQNILLTKNFSFCSNHKIILNKWLSHLKFYARLLVKSSEVEWHFTMVTMKEKRSIVGNRQPVQIDGYSQSFVATVKILSSFAESQTLFKWWFCFCFCFCRGFSTCGRILDLFTACKINLKKCLG